MRASLTQNLGIFSAVAVGGDERQDAAAIGAALIEIAAILDEEVHEAGEGFGDHAAVGFEQDVIVGVLAGGGFFFQKGAHALVAPPFVGDG